ncbi:MAG: glycoside hydrolase family 13 protein [Defluviitaleaceae bacterium]|nr:glycoside hydrolase family 13 protein [Defluviitaleaceae bacterium]
MNDIEQTFHIQAVFSDETRQFVSPYDPKPSDAVQVRLRVARGDKVRAWLHVCGEDVDALVMEKELSDELFDYYMAEIIAPAHPVRYYYSLEFEGQVFYYNKMGLTQSCNHHFDFRLVPGMRLPDWARGAVMYQIFVDRFYNGDSSNDVLKHEYAYLGRTAMAMEWHQDVTNSDFCSFYGGDLQGVMDKMDYLKGLGVEVVYLNPVFVSPSSHKYDIQDYDYIDPHYGVIVEDEGEVLRFERANNEYATRYQKRTTSRANLDASNQLMAEFIEKAHAYGMKVILDGVFNHCGSFNKWLDVPGFYRRSGQEAGAYHSKDSPYHDYFLWHGDEWPNNSAYDGWWGNGNHPKLNFEDSKELFDYIIEVGKKWVSPPYNADGWRLDVAADLGRSPEMNHNFWQKFHDAVKAANPEAIILAEHYGDPSHWLNGKEWDTIMNYDAFMEPITWFLTGVNKHSEESRPALKGDAMTFEWAMRFNMALLNVHSLQAAMNQLSNHDHSRFLTRTSSNTGRLHTVGSRAAEIGVKKNIMMEAVVFQMTWPGAPTIYYGDEAGAMGWTDPDNRRPFPWGREDETLIELHKCLINLRKNYSVLRHGSVDFLWSSHGFISYGRWDENEKIVVAINNNNKPIDVKLPVWKIGLKNSQLTQLIVTGAGTFFETSRKHQVVEGQVNIHVPGHGAVVLGQIV